MSELLKFHLSCTDEYNKLLTKFNLLFFGYGCKQKLLKEMFPDAYLINYKYQKTTDLIEELQLEGATECKNIKELDEELKINKKYLYLICINFNFNCTELLNLSRIKLLGTI